MQWINSKKNWDNIGAKIFHQGNAMMQNHRAKDGKWCRLTDCHCHENIDPLGQTQGIMQVYLVATSWVLLQFQESTPNLPKLAREKHL